MEQLALNKPRKEHSSIIIKDCLFVLFGEHKEGQACMTVKYLPLSDPDQSFRILQLKTPHRNKPLVFKRPMIFPDHIELRLKDRLAENQTRVIFFGGEYAYMSCLAFMRCACMSFWPSGKQIFLSW